MSRALAVLCLLATTVPFAVSQTRTDLPVALRKALEAGPRLRYTGKRHVEFRREGKAESYTEFVTRDGNKMRIDFPAGSTYTGQVIVETKGERRHFFPDKNEIQISPPRREEAFDRLMKLGKNARFKFSVGPEETVAGIAADQIVVSDKNGNVEQRLFIDPKSGMLLKRKIFDDVGTQVGFFEFKTVDLSPTITPNVFQLNRKGAKLIQPIDLLKRTVSEGGFALAYVRPESGFKLAFTKTNNFDGKDVLMQFYSSKQGRLSLFQTKAEVSKAQLDRFSRGDVTVYSWKAKGKTFVLIGNQSKADLKKLAGQIAFD